MAINYRIFAIYDQIYGQNLAVINGSVKFCGIGPWSLVSKKQITSSLESACT